MQSLIASLVVLALAGTASAQPGMTEPIPPGASEPIPPAALAPRPELKSEGKALWWSLGGTLASYGLLVSSAVLAASSSNVESPAFRLSGPLGSAGLVGTFLAPSFGHWYAGKGFTRGFALRISGVGVGIVGLLVAVAGCSLFYGGHEDDSGYDGCGNPTAGGVIALMGAGLYVGGTVDDIVQAPRRVRRLNAERSLTVMPLFDRDSGGLALAGSF